MHDGYAEMRPQHEDFPLFSVRGSMTQKGLPLAEEVKEREEWNERHEKRKMQVSENTLKLPRKLYLSQNRVIIIVVSEQTNKLDAILINLRDIIHPKKKVPNASCTTVVTNCTKILKLKHVVVTMRKKKDN